MIYIIKDMIMGTIPMSMIKLLPSCHQFYTMLIELGTPSLVASDSYIKLGTYLAGSRIKRPIGMLCDYQTFSNQPIGTIVNRLYNNHWTVAYCCHYWTHQGHQLIITSPIFWESKHWASGLSWSCRSVEPTLVGFYGEDGHR